MGVQDATSNYSWGSKLTEANYYGYRPREDYFKTGLITSESVSLSTGTQKNQTYASVAAINSKGIVPNNTYNRYNFSIRNTTSFLQDKMLLDINGSYVLQNDRNMLNQGVYGNPLLGAYLYPRGNDWKYASMYEMWDPTRRIYTQNWNVGDAGLTMQNPYWINYRNLRENKKHRYTLGASLSYKVLDWLTLSGRVRLDHATNEYTQRYYAGTNTQLTEHSIRGSYGVTKTNDRHVYADFLASINKQLGDNWHLQANFGGSFTELSSDALNIYGGIADGTDAYP